MSEVNKEKLIEEAIQHDNIHEACVVIQVALGIGDGAWAEWFFSGETPYLSREELNNIAGEQTPRWLGQGLLVTDIEKAYPKMSDEARRELFTRYYEAEEKVKMSEVKPPYVLTEQGNTVIDRNEVVRTIALEVDAHAKGNTDADYHAARDTVLYSYFRDVDNYVFRIRS
jgi:hypothetical protein